jgi:wobble nucleotide-excising tRNase
MDYYDREQPGDHIQELHSILGTELADLGEELNSYYNRYFADRAALVSLHDQYSKIINDNIETQKKLITEINALNQSLNASIVAYNSAVKQLNSDVAALEVERLKIDTTSIYEVSNFNSKRNALIKRINSLESQNTAITADQSKYNDLINQYNQTVIIGNGLTNSLDSTLQAPATL